MRKDVCFLCRPINFYRAKRVMQYDVTSQKAFITEKDTKETLHYLWLLFKEAYKINREFDDAFRKFGEEAGRLQTEDFWRGYLEIEHKKKNGIAEIIQNIGFICFYYLLALFLF